LVITDPKMAPVPDSKVIPTCRYQHGPLTRAIYEGVDTWGLVALGGQPNTAFSFELFVCLTCGYSEIFDTEPAKTKADLESHE
jgi:hypothetical protein